MNLFERIKALCDKKGVSIAKLERETGLGNGTVKNWGKVAPSSDRLAKVAKYLYVSTDYLLGIDPLPAKEVTLWEGTGLDEVVTYDSGDLEFEAFKEYLEKMGYQVSLDIAKLGNSKKGPVWIIHDVRSDEHYAVKPDDLDMLTQNVLTYTKSSIQDVLSKAVKVTKEPPK